MSGDARSNYITPEGFERLKREHEELWTVERPRVTREVSAAAAQGDRSENAEYIYGKKRLREIDGRLRFLAKRMDELIVVNESPPAADRVYFGAWVTLEDEDGEQSCYRLVGPDEFDPKEGFVSVDSPIGRALMGRRIDDAVTVRRPRGDAEFTIVAIAFEPPA